MHVYMFIDSVVATLKTKNCISWIHSENVCIFVCLMVEYKITHFANPMSVFYSILHIPPSSYFYLHHAHAVGNLVTHMYHPSSSSSLP